MPETVLDATQHRSTGGLAAPSPDEVRSPDRTQPSSSPAERPPDPGQELGGLALQARDGDPAALAALYAACGPAVYRFGYARTRNPADAEDILQATFLRLVEALPRYEDRGVPFQAWLFRICRSVAVDAHRRRRPQLPLDELGDVADPDSSTPAEADRLADVVDALGHLTLDQRQVIELRFFADLSARDAGLVMGRDDDAVRALQARALVALRRRLGVDRGAGTPDTDRP